MLFGIEKIAMFMVFITVFITGDLSDSTGNCLQLYLLFTFTATVLSLIQIQNYLITKSSAETKTHNLKIEIDTVFLSARKYPSTLAVHSYL